MIPRYSRPEMVAIWEPQNRFRIWFEIEAHATDALAELGVVPKEAAKIIWEKGGNATFDVARIDEIERVTKHDVIAFLTHLSEIVGPEARFVHQGMTSSDVLDTTLAVQLAQASDILIADVDALLAALKRRAFEHKLTPTIGRSHGIHAEPVTFGLKLAQAYAEFARCRQRLFAARAEVATCAISGAVGTFANIDPKVEAHVAAKMGLSVEPVSTQVIPRDRHAMFFATLGVVASSVERLATEIRHLQRTEVYEAEEFFSPGQKGSSAMPHKRNPVLTENLTGLARLVRGMVTPALENVALWHERDISHSSVERMIGPDATVTLDFALARLTGVIDKLLVYPDNMRKNLDRLGGLHNSQRVLLALTQAGSSREESYNLVQRNAMKVWEQGKDFLTELKADADVTARLTNAQLEAMFDEGYHFKHVDTIFARVFGEAWTMRTADASILIIPGFGDSGPGHWQTRWEAKLPSATRVIQPDWTRADRAQWAGTIAGAVEAADKPVVLVAHSIGVAAVAHAAHLFTKPVAGAFLVGLSDWNREELLPGVTHDFAPLPREPFSFPSWLIASRNDPYCDYDVAADFANAWGSRLIDAGESGHINIESGHGPWPEGLMSFAGFMKNL